MTLLEVLASMARKLGLTEHEIIILYMFNRSGARNIFIARALRILNKMVETHGLIDESDSPTYGEQLSTLRVLTEFEGSVLSGIDEVIDLPSPQVVTKPKSKRRKKRATK